MRLGVVLVVCSVLFAGGMASAANWVGWDSYYFGLQVRYDSDGNNDTSEMWWTWYLASYGVVDYAYVYAYYGMGLDKATSAWGWDAFADPPTFYLYYSSTDGALGYCDNYDVYLNTYYMASINASNWETLHTEAWIKGSTLTHEVCHVFFYQMTLKSISASANGYWYNLLTESIAHYVGNCLWPVQDPDETYYWPSTWQDIASKAYTYWGWSSTSGWTSIGSWSDIATTYNFGYDYSYADRLHFWAFGYFLANYYDMWSGYTGYWGSNGYSPLNSSGYGGSWNYAQVLWLIRTGYTPQNALAYVYSPSGYSYSSNMYTMGATTRSLNSAYYWYWWYLAYYS